MVKNGFKDIHYDMINKIVYKTIMLTIGVVFVIIISIFISGFKLQCHVQEHI
jgi:hypothetical protein